MPTNITDLILQRLNRIEEKVDNLQSDFDRRRGALRTLVATVTLLGSFCGWAGSYLHDLVSKS